MTGRGLKKWREAHGFTQQELAKALMLSVGVVVQWEKQVGSTLPTFLQTRLNYLAKAKEREQQEAQGDVQAGP